MKGTKKEVHINDKVIHYTHIEKRLPVRFALCFQVRDTMHDKPLFYYCDDAYA